MKNIKQDATARLEAKKMLLEQESRSSVMRLQNNLDYVKGNSSAIIGNEVTNAIEKKNPTIAKVVSLVIPNSRKKKTRVERIYRRDIDLMETEPSKKGMNPTVEKLITIGGALLPIILGFSKKKLLKLGLKSSGSIIKFLVKRTFRGLFK